MAKKFKVTVDQNQYVFTVPTVRDYQMAQNSAGKDGDNWFTICSFLLTECYDSLNGKQITPAERIGAFRDIPLADQLAIQNKVDEYLKKPVDSAILEEIF